MHEDARMQMEEARLRVDQLIEAGPVTSAVQVLGASGQWPDNDMESPAGRGARRRCRLPNEKEPWILSVAVTSSIYHRTYVRSISYIFGRVFGFPQSAYFSLRTS